jgi:tetratricopeptide (TPR) repeat protein
VIAVGDVRDPREHDIAALLATHHEEVEMNAAFRVATLERTRRIVASKAHTRARRLAFGCAVAAAVAVTAAVLLRHPSHPQPSRHLPKTASRPTPTIASEPGRMTQTGGSQRVAGGKKVEITKTLTTAEGATLPRRLARVRTPTPPKPAAVPLAAVVAARPPVTDGAGRAIKAGDRLLAGATVRTGSGARVRLVTRRGSEFALNVNSELSLVAANAARLRRGELYCRSRRGEIARIDTLAGRIHLLGTVLDAACVNSHQVAVTVVAGKVRLSNAHGEAVVPAGKRSLMVATAPPTAGAPTNVLSQTTWYDGRGTVLSDFGDISYVVRRAEGLLTEIWAMKADGTDKHRVKTYLGYSSGPAAWLPGQQWMLLATTSVLWSRPDLASHRADVHAGHPIVQEAEWLLDAATGQDLPLQLPAGYRPLYQELSPDAARLAFCGGYRPDPKDPKKGEGGVWVYDLRTGEIKKVLDGWIKTPIAWAPDSRRLVASTGEGYGSNYPLVVVDADTAEATPLNVQGGGARFSPDGTKLAYCGDFKRTGSWYCGVLMSGSIFVLDLEPGGQPRRISPEGEGDLEPRWSPDGTRVAYWVSNDKWVPDQGPYFPGYRIFVAQADGSGTQEVYRKDPVDEHGLLRTVSWTPDGDSLYVSTADGVLVVAPDGSGVRSDLGGNDKDSVLPPAQRAQTAAALEAVREAIFEYAVGNVRSFEARPADACAAFQSSADVFAGLAWRYPLADFSTNDVLRYADKAQAMAARPPATVLLESCKQRMNYAGLLLSNCAASLGRFPPDLAALEQWSLSNNWGIDWISNHNTEWVKMILRCPEGAPFTYTAPPAGEDPKIGDIVMSCPIHPDCRLVWDERQARMLSWRREAAVRQARQNDPELTALYEKAVELRDAAEFGVASWKEAEDAHLAVLKRSPQDVETRTYLGRMYTRWGRYREALQTLPSGVGVLGGWAALNRAFCLDALGQRDQAIAIYQQVLQAGGSDTITAWAKLGLQRPAWPRDLDVSARPGEVRLMPGPTWHASASGSRSPGKPEFAIDDNRYTRWATSGNGHGQTPDTWFQLDFGAPQVVSRVVIDHLGLGNYVVGSWARGLAASVTSDGKTWEKVPCDPAGPIQPASIRLNSARAITAIRLNVTAVSDPEWWSIYEIYVFGPSERAR